MIRAAALSAFLILASGCAQAIPEETGTVAGRTRSTAVPTPGSSAPPAASSPSAKPGSKTADQRLSACVAGDLRAQVLRQVQGPGVTGIVVRVSRPGAGRCVLKGHPIFSGRLQKGCATVLEVGPSATEPSSWQSCPPPEADGPIRTTPVGRGAAVTVGEGRTADFHVLTAVICFKTATKLAFSLATGGPRVPVGGDVHRVCGPVRVTAFGAVLDDR